MSLQLKKPILTVGLGGVGSRLAVQASEILGTDYLLISNDQNDLDFTGGSDANGSNDNRHCMTIHVSTDPVINPSVMMIKSATQAMTDKIRSSMEGYSTVVLMGNLAGRAGVAMSPIVSRVCKQEQSMDVISFVVMPFKYEKDRIFNSGISLKRIRENSQYTIVLDNNALLESNPDLSPSTCFGIANPAIMHVVKALGSPSSSSSAMIMTPNETGIIAASKTNAITEDYDYMAVVMESSLRDSLKMLYDNVPPTTIKRSMVYVVGGKNIPAGVLNSIVSLANGTLNESVSYIDTASASGTSGIVVLSSVQATARFDGYDPLGMIPLQDTLDWPIPECGLDCKIESAMYQLE